MSFTIFLNINSMKKIYLLFAFSVVSASIFAQKDNVGIGTTKPDQSAILDLSSQNKGLLVPRMSLEQRGSVQNPANGLMIYQTDFLSGFYFYDGKEWKPLTSATDAKSVADANNWGLLGNAGTNSSTNFIGTTDNQALVFKVNNSRAGYIETGTTFNTSFGYQTNNNLLGTFNTAFGYRALASTLAAGVDNTAIGSQALSNNSSGFANVALGRDALVFNVGGYRNMAVGSFALKNNLNGYENVAIGNGSLFNNEGSLNIAIGSLAGVGKTGNGNVYLGAGAGQSGGGGSATAESNKLYIANSNTTTPLIGGDFGTIAYGGSGSGTVKVHLGSSAPTNTTGFLAIGDFSAVTPPILTFTGTNTYRLIVQDGIMTEKIKVAIKGSADWADYVFEPSYKLMSLDKVESFIKENKHLPNVPSADEMAKSGLDVMQTSAKMMEKIEELTLYMIEMNKEIKALKAENAKLKK